MAIYIYINLYFRISLWFNGNKMLAVSHKSGLELISSFQIIKKNYSRHQESGVWRRITTVKFLARMHYVTTSSTFIFGRCSGNQGFYAPYFDMPWHNQYIELSLVSRLWAKSMVWSTELITVCQNFSLGFFCVHAIFERHIVYLFLTFFFFILAWNYSAISATSSFNTCLAMDIFKYS